MNFRNIALILPAAALLAGCQSKSAKEQALEQRVQELETALAASPSAQPSPSELVEAPPAPAPMEQAPEAPPAATASAPRKAQPKAASRPAPRTARGDVRGGPAGRERMERLPSARPEGDDDGDQEFGRQEAVETRPTRMVLPQGTELTLILETPVSSATSQEGDQVEARVERAIGEDGRIVLPGGTVLRGRVTEARASGRVSGRARVAVDFDRIVVRGRTHELDASPIVAEAPGESGRDAKIIGGSAAGGAIIGAITGGRKGATKGAVIGAGAGTAAVLVTKGREIEMPSGSRWTVRVKDPVRL